MSLDRRDLLLGGLASMSATALAPAAAAEGVVAGTGEPLIAPGGLSIHVLRIYSGPDGESHCEDAVLPAEEHDFFGVPKGLRQFFRFRASRVSLFTAPADVELREHGVTSPEMFYVIRGSSELVLRDGTRRHVGPGMLVMFEDTIGHGHGGRTGPEGYTAINVSFVRESGS